MVGEVAVADLLSLEAAVTAVLVLAAAAPASGKRSQFPRSHLSVNPPASLLFHASTTLPCTSLVPTPQIHIDAVPAAAGAAVAVGASIADNCFDTASLALAADGEGCAGADSPEPPFFFFFDIGLQLGKCREKKRS